jgi:hypothetical protein
MIFSPIPCHMLMCVDAWWTLTKKQRSSIIAEEDAAFRKRFNIRNRLYLTRHIDRDLGFGLPRCRRRRPKFFPEPRNTAVFTFDPTPDIRSMAPVQECLLFERTLLSPEPDDGGENVVVGGGGQRGLDFSTPLVKKVPDISESQDTKDEDAVHVRNVPAVVPEPSIRLASSGLMTGYFPAKKTIG